MDDLLNYTDSLSKGVKNIRHERRLTQGAFAKLLDLSQAQFSKVENGQASLTAEQFLFILKYFNLTLSHFIKNQNPEDERLSLQNALIRFGASHLTENRNVIVIDKFTHPSEVVFQALAIYPSARLVTSLAPVIVKSFDQINFLQIENKLFEKNGNANRLWWLIESTLKALDERLNGYIPYKKISSAYKRCRIPLFSQLHFKQRKEATQEDILDTSINSEETFLSIQKQRDELAEKWKVMTSIKQSDFNDALGQAEEYD